MGYKKDVGIRERIQQVQEAERIAEAEARRAEETRAAQRQEQYQQELPQVLNRQRRLFNELKVIGVVEMVDEMIYPSHLHPPISPEEEKKRAKRSDRKRAVGLPKETKLTDEKLDEVMREIGQQQWWSEVLPPQQNEDGSLDDTLQIIIQNKWDTGYALHPMHGELKKVFLSYSRERLLTIKGTETTFEGAVSKRNVEKDVIETALAQAFHKPYIPQRETPTGETRRIGLFAS